MFISFVKHGMELEYMFMMFLNATRIQYLCNINFLGILIHDVSPYCDAFLNVLLCSCYINRCCLPPFIISCRLNSFLRVKNVGDLVRNFFPQTFASSYLLQSMIFDESKRKRLIASQRRYLTEKEGQLEICCF